MRDSRWWIDFEDFLVPHTDMDGLPAVKAVGVDMDLRTRKEPAHGQHFDPSLSVPFLLPIDCYTMMCRYVGERCP
jgi:hypothetical protein